MENSKTIIKNPFILLFISGLLLTISFFIHNIYAQILALFAIAPAFYAITKVDGIKRYLGGLIFFGSWIIPTSYWYFLIFPWWDAALRLTFFTFIALTFYIPTLIKRRSLFLDYSIIILVWIFITAVRLNLPFTQGWWIPHIAYTQWLNPLLVQIAGFLGVYGIVLFILLINATIAYLFTKKNYLIMSLLAIIIIASCLSGSIFLQKTTELGYRDITLLAIQSMPLGGVHSNAVHEDITNLKSLTLIALKDIDWDNSLIFVVWPENMIKPKEDENLKEFSRENNIYLVYNREESSKEEFPFNTVVMLNPDGEAILTNYKKHAAPGEKITASSQFETIVIKDIRVVTDICYDLHYPDISERVNNTDLLIAPVDDDRFGTFMPYLHAADVVFRAIENKINIITASTNGPTFYVNKYGIVEKIPLPLYKEGVLVVETKI